MQKINKMKLIFKQIDFINYEYLKPMYYIQSKMYFMKYDHNSILDPKYYSKEKDIKNGFNIEYLKTVNNDYDKLCKEFIKLDNKLQNYLNNRIKQVYYIIRLPLQTSDILKLIDVDIDFYRNMTKPHLIGSYSLLRRLHDLYNKYIDEPTLFSLECAAHSVEQYEIKDKQQVNNEYDRLLSIINSNVRNLYYHEQPDFFPAYDRYTRNLPSSKDDIQLWQLDYFKNDFNDDQVSPSSVKNRLNLK